LERIGIYGGTFNPPHVGHIRGAEYAICALQLKKLLLIPSCTAPHKDLPANSPTPAQRAEMLELAKGENMEVSDMELTRGGTSYTYETVEQLAKQYPDKELVLLMGTDMFLSFLS
jgi:nicotinate-nucleotide adenylyltransferase